MSNAWKPLSGGLDVVQISHVFDVPLSFLIEYGQINAATMLAAEREGIWWSIGRHRNPFPVMNLTPRLDRVLVGMDEIRVRIVAAIEVVRHGVPEDGDGW